MQILEVAISPLYERWTASESRSVFSVPDWGGTKNISISVIATPREIRRIVCGASFPRKERIANQPRQIDLGLTNALVDRIDRYKVALDIQSVQIDGLREILGKNSGAISMCCET